MTSSRESSRRSSANRLRTGLVPVGAAVLSDGAPDFVAGLPAADGPRDRMCQRVGIEAHAGVGGIVGIAIASGRGWKLWRRRHPRRPLEDVLHRAPLLDVDRKVGSRKFQRESRRFLQPLANAFERVRVGQLLGTHHSRRADEDAGQPERNRAHLISTISPSIWPVEDGR